MSTNGLVTFSTFVCYHSNIGHLWFQPTELAPVEPTDDEEDDDDEGSPLHSIPTDSIPGILNSRASLERSLLTYVSTVTKCLCYTAYSFVTFVYNTSAVR